MDARPSLGLPALRRYQARTLLALARGVARDRGATFTVLYPRQAGKNEVAAALVATLLASHAARGGSIVVCAPTFSPQAEISVERVRRTLDGLARVLPAGTKPSFSANTVSVGRARAVFLSASPEAHVAGHTASLALIADEAQDIDEEWFDRQFRPMAASTGAPTVLFGTPWDGATLLDRAVAANREHDAEPSPPAPLPEGEGRGLGTGLGSGGFVPRHHEVGWREVAASNEWYGAYVRAERRRLGAGHPLFRTQYGLETVEEAGRLLTAADLRALDGTHDSLEGPAPGERYVAGLDLAGEGERGDASVLTVARLLEGRVEVVAHEAWRGVPFAGLREDVIAAAGHWRFERLTVDATGLGAVLASDFEAVLGASVVERVTFSAAVKSELGYALIAAAKTGRLALAAGALGAHGRTLRAELAACRARYGSGRLLHWAAPPGGHDDYSVSLALCLRAAEGAGPPRIARGR